MERRLLGIALSAAHFVIVTAALSLLAFVAYYGWLYMQVMALSATPTPSWQQEWLPLLFAAIVLVLLTIYWTSVAFAGLVYVKRGFEQATFGAFHEASARLRRMRDLEPYLRLLGVPGRVFANARIGEAYVYQLHGVSQVAYSLALEEARSWFPVGHSAASIAIAAAAELADPRFLEHPALRRHLAWAHRRRDRPVAQGILLSEGVSWVLALRIDDAERRAAELLAASPRGRHGRMLRATVLQVRGDLAGAKAELQSLRAEPISRGFPVLLRQLADASFAEVLRLEGDLAGAGVIGIALANEGPRHRVTRLASIAYSGIAAAIAGDPALGRQHLGRLDDLEAGFAHDVLMPGRIAIARARLLRALGDPAAAVACLAPAVSSPAALIRHEGLFEQGEARSDAGDGAGANESFRFCAAMAETTRSGRLAKERAAAAVVAPTA